MAIEKFGSAHWVGGLKDGKGHVSTESGALKSQPYGFNTRFENTPGTNPEELVGAAHAACFTMALSKTLGGAGVAADELETKATVFLEKVGDDFAISKINLHLRASVSGMTEEKFRSTAEEVKSACPVSKALATVPIGLDIAFI
jgi:osmotically inducible protein OsmC